jgi:rhodanese-related sulfurtransferase
MSQQNDLDHAVPDDMTLSDLIGLIESGIPFTLLDVREPQEWQSGHLEGAQLLPLGQVLSNPEALSTLSKSLPLVVYCQHGIRSLRAVRYLREQGFDAFNLLVDWSSLDRD